MATTQDDAFREIQLSGKQLVFLFMAVVVIAVVIFLTGVQVGRGVRAERGIAEGTEASVGAGATAEPQPPPASSSAASTSTPVTAGEKLSYAERLGGAAPPPEPKEDTPPPKPDAPAAAIPPTPAPTAAKPAPVAASPVKPAPAAAAPVNPAAIAPELAASGFTIQVAALREREEADAIVKRLAAKGYPAYVLAPAKGAPTVFRVRVGKYKERREADTVAARLQKEEQFKPWVVR
jgi:DedD protein